ncbi:MAG: biotin/lipoyl-containing protein [Vicinamibacterales bacterium]
MLFEIEVNGRTRQVTIERARVGHGRYRVSIDGVPSTVDAAAVASNTLSLVFPDDGGRSCAVGVEETSSDTLTLHVNGARVPATIDGARLRRTAADAKGSGEQIVLSPMPGKVLRVLVGEGDEVAARQPLVVVEAMKMENEMSAPRPGRVKRVLVTAGTSVEAGRVLVIVE